MAGSATSLAGKSALGAGYGRFPIIYRDAQAAYFATHPNSWAQEITGSVNYAFNTGIKLLVETGSFGLLLSLGWLIALLAIKTPYRPAKATLIGIIVFSLFSYPFESLTIAVNFTISAAIVVHASTGERGWQFIVSKRNSLLIPSLIVFMCAIVGVQQYKQLVAIEKWKQIALLVQIDPDTAFQQYQEVYYSLSNVGDFMYNYGTELSEAGFHEESIKVLDEVRFQFNHIDLHIYQGINYQKVGDYEKAQEAYKYASSMIPSRFYPKYLMANLYLEIGQTEKALALAKVIIATEPKVPSSTVWEIKEEMQNIVNQFD